MFKDNKKKKKQEKYPIWYIESNNIGLENNSYYKIEDNLISDNELEQLNNKYGLNEKNYLNAI